MTTKLYKNITNKKITLPITFDEVEPGSTYSVTSEYPQPLNVEGMVDISDLSADEQKDKEKDAKNELEK